MSLLLDALRKSANQRHLGNAPGLEEGLRQTIPHSGKQRSWLVPVLLVAIVLAMVAGKPWEHFLDSEPDKGSVEVAEPMVKPIVEEAPAPPRAEPVRKEPVRRLSDAAEVSEEVPDYGYNDLPDPEQFALEDDADYVAQQLYRAQLDPDDDELVDGVDDGVAKAILRDVLENSEASDEYREFIRQIAAEERGELEEYPGTDDLGVGFTSDPEAANAGTLNRLPGAQRLDELADEVEEAGRAVGPAARATRAETNRTGANNTAAAVAQKPAPPVTIAAPEGSSDEDEAPELGVISYYELPANVRSSLPEIDIRIRVYDENPEKRFVVAGSDRIREGESIADGVVLHRIRRDALVLNYQSYVFYWDKR